MGQGAPLIADSVYSQPLNGDRHKDVAKALHVAVKRLHGKVGEGAFERWASYIHNSL